jgi:hypothetical protein
MIKYYQTFQLNTLASHATVWPEMLKWFKSLLFKTYYHESSACKEAQSRSPEILSLTIFSSNTSKPYEHKITHRHLSDCIYM